MAVLSKGVTHRDIKPSNLILDGEGRLRILDFGLARLEGQESLTLSGDFLGTVLYMSPEQAMAKRIRVDHRTDIYSLGATMYEMLTWKPPFQGKHHQDTLSQIMFRDPRPPRQLNPRIPKDLETIVLKCLRKDPVDRYRTAEALGQDLRRFVRGDPIEARSQAGWEKVVRRVWRLRTRIAVTVLASLLLLTSGILLFKYYAAGWQRDRVVYEAKVLDAVMRLQLGGIALDPEGGGPLRVDTQGRAWGFDDFQSLLRDARLDPVNEVVDGLVDTARILRSRPMPITTGLAGWHISAVMRMRARSWCGLSSMNLTSSLRKSSSVLSSEKKENQNERRLEGACTLSGKSQTLIG